MSAERDVRLPPVQPGRRTAVVRGLHPRLWPKRVLPRPNPEPEEAPEQERREPPSPEAPLTYDDHAHLHGGPQPKPRVDLED